MTEGKEETNENCCSDSGNLSLLNGTLQWKNDKEYHLQGHSNLHNSLLSLGYVLTSSIT